MATNGHRLITREAWPLFALLLVLAVLAKLYIGILYGAVLLSLPLLVLFIFRDPRRAIPSAPLAVVSPASGTVTSIDDNVNDPWLQREARCCRLRMSLLDVHYLRSPIEGKIMNQWYTSGDEPGIRRRYTYWIKTDEGDDVVLSLALGPLSWWVKVAMQSGDRIGQGQPCGLMLLAGRIDIYLPQASRLEINQGDKLDSGSAILGKFIHNKPVATAFVQS